MEDKKITLDGNDKGQQAAYAMGYGLGHREGVHDTFGGIGLTALAGCTTIVTLLVATPVIKKAKEKIDGWKEKYKLKKEQKLKAKEEKAE